MDWVANFENTRWFLVVRLERGSQDSLNKILKASNETSTAFGQLPLYSQPRVPSDIVSSHSSKMSKRASGTGSSIQIVSVEPTPPKKIEDKSSHFHVSIGWTLGPPPKAVVNQLRELANADKPFHIEVTAVKLKIGNNISVVSLSPKTETSNGIIGR